MCTVSGNTAGERGGGIYNGGTATLTNCTLSDNQASFGGGGGPWNAGTATLIECTVSGNELRHPEFIPAGGLGGIANEGGVTMARCTVSGNWAGSIGSGGVVWSEGTLDVAVSVISGNSASSKGGISNDGTATFVGCTISDNRACGYRGGSGRAGGVFNAATLVLAKSTLFGNSAGFGDDGALGGGVENVGTATLTDCTISGNAVSSYLGGEGAGLLNTAGSATLTNRTVSGNLAEGALSFATQGTDVSIGGGGVTLSNTIVAGNTARNEHATLPSDINGIVSPASRLNLIGTGGTAALANGVDGNKVGVADAKLGPRADNGGSTKTHALLPGSPAINARSPAERGALARGR